MMGKNGQRNILNFTLGEIGVAVPPQSSQCKNFYLFQAVSLVTTKLSFVIATG